MYRLPRSVVSALVIAALIAGTLSGGREAPAAVAGAIAAVGLAFGVARPIVGLAVACIVALIAPFLIVPQRLGIQPPIADWGGMVRENAVLITFNDFTPLLPAAAIALLTVSVNFVIDWVLQKASGLKE